MKAVNAMSAKGVIQRLITDKALAISPLGKSIRRRLQS